MKIEASADIDPRATLGAGCVVWHLAQIREDAVLGEQCTVGRGAYIGPGVRLGARCKVQNHALVYEPAILADGVFIGPGVVLTNDAFPRAITPQGRLKGAADWDRVGVRVEYGASIGARAVCVAPVRIGAWALVAAGAVVVRDVAPFSLMVGVPARRVAWVGTAGVPLRRVGTSARWRCPRTGEEYLEHDGELSPADDAATQGPRRVGRLPPG